MNIENQQPPNLSQYPQTSTLAIISIVMGILSWVALPVIGAIAAVITGHMARNEIKNSLGQLTGDGLATAGLVLGYLHLGLTVTGACVFIILIAFGIITPLLCLPFTNSLNSWMQILIGF